MLEDELPLGIGNGETVEEELAPNVPGVLGSVEAVPAGVDGDDAAEEVTVGV